MEFLGEKCADKASASSAAAGHLNEMADEDFSTSWIEAAAVARRSLG